MNRSIFIIFIVFLLPSASLWAAPPFILDRPGYSYPVLPGAEYFRFTGKQLSLDQVRALPPTRWKPSRGAHISYPAGPEQLWVRFSLTAPEKGEWFLVSEFPIIDYLDLYVLQGQKQILHLKDGDAQDVGARAYPNRYPVLPIMMEANQVYHLYVNVRTSTTQTLLLRVMKPGYYYDKDSRETALYALLLFMTVLLILINLNLAIRSRSRLPLLYISFLVTYVFYQLRMAGYMRESLAFLETDFNDRVGYFSGGLSLLLFAQLWRDLVLTKVHAPFLDTCLKVFMGLTFALMIFSLIPDPSPEMIHFGMRWSMYLAGFFMPLVMLSGIVAYRKGFRPALFSIWAGLFHCSFMTIYLLAMLGVFETAFSLLHILYVGCILDGALFFLSFSRRINFNQSEIEGKAESNPESKVEAASIKLSPGKTTRVDIDDKAKLLLNLMNEDKLFCDDDLSLEGLGGHLDLKVAQVSELLNANFGKGFHRFINEHRIWEAQRLLLEDPTRKVLSVALASGFNSKSSFNTEFKKIVGETPSAFRKGCLDVRRGVA